MFMSDNDVERKFHKNMNKRKSIQITTENRKRKLDKLDQ